MPGGGGGAQPREGGPVRRALRFLAALTLVAAALLFWPPGRPVTPVERNSYLSDFSVEGDTVTIRAVVALKNATDADVTVSLAANFTEDVEGGLLKEARLRGRNADGGETFVVPANGEAAFNVAFAGVFGGTAQKKDRLLPAMEITVIE